MPNMARFNMARRLGLLALALSSSTVMAQDSATSTNTEDEQLILTGSGSFLLSQPATPTGPYTSYDRITLTGTNEPSDVSGSVSSDDNSTSTRVPISQNTDFTLIVGQETTMSGNFSATSSAAEPQVTNTRPCNNYVELCNRKYSNITNVAAHNSPFVRPGNAGSNQDLPVVAQLNDGVRLLQAQMQYPENGTEPHFCHTTCDLLDAGPITEWFTTVRQWVEHHPFDVVTILLGNGNYSTPDHYAPYIESTGILKYAYEPSVFPMERDDWPTLAEMIIRGKRVVIFMDYMADQKQYPWLLDQFSQMWETPCNPQNRDFPCTAQRPPDLSREAANKRLYLFNHNLNVEYNLFGGSILIPAVSLLNETNDVSGYGSLGESTEGCVSEWGHPPNFLNVDYYNYGSFPGSVFEVAATFNNVTYERGQCCGLDLNIESGAARTSISAALVVALGVALAMAA